jgi:hypothetical protein
MNESYIIAFTHGSSGRFAKYLLFNLLTGSLKELDICPVTNSTHKSDIGVYTGYRHIRENSDILNKGINNPDIWNFFKFDDPLEHPNAPKILATHVFPDFELIKQRLGPNVKIIIITLDAHDIKEVVVNDKVKNYYDVLTGNSRHTQNAEIMHELIKRYVRFLGKKYPATFVKEDIIEIGKSVAMVIMGHLLSNAIGNPVSDPDGDAKVARFLKLPEHIDYPKDQILFLPYSEISSATEDGYVWLNKLEKFTGKTANAVTKRSYEKYVNGRRKLLKEYRL